MKANKILLLLVIFGAQGLYGSQGRPGQNINIYSTANIASSASSGLDLLSAAASSAANLTSKVYLCPERGCGKSYSWPSHLTRHIEAKHDNVQYECPECGKNFSDINNLKKHSNIHRGIRFNCAHPGCNKSYSQKEGLTRHMKKHSNTTFDCTYPGCTKVFTEQSNLRRHIKKHHEDALLSGLTTDAGPAADAGPPPLVGLNGEPYEDEEK